MVLDCPPISAAQIFGGEAVDVVFSLLVLLLCVTATECVGHVFESSRAP